MIHWKAVDSVTVLIGLQDLATWPLQGEVWKRSSALAKHSVLGWGKELLHDQSSSSLGMDKRSSSLPKAKALGSKVLGIATCRKRKTEVSNATQKLSERWLRED